MLSSTLTSVQNLHNVPFMCGIAGLLVKDQNSEPLSVRVKQMTDAIVHRGPDGEGFYFDTSTGLALGHRRLSIIDLSDLAQQPMVSQDGRYVLCFNGEIFNYIELAQELRALGVHFQSQSDTEVLLHALIRWGEAALRRCNGMWSFVFYDKLQGTLLASVDRFNVKPFYFWHHLSHKVSFAFASEQKAIAAFIDLEFDEKAVRTAILNPGGLEASGHALYKNVFSLTGGHNLHLNVNTGQLNITRWWNTAEEASKLAATPGAVPEKFEDQVARFRELFIDACRLRMRSDVPVGTSLSGGLDSTAVASVLTELRKKGITQSYKAFIHCFRDSPLDESQFAQAAVDHLGLDPVWLEPKPGVIVEEIDTILTQFEGIYPGITDGSWRIYREQRKHGVYVSLDGHGADELLGGYYQHLYPALWDSIGGIKGGLNGKNSWRQLMSQVQEQAGPFFTWKGTLLGLLRNALSGNQNPNLTWYTRGATRPLFRALGGGEDWTSQVYQPKTFMEESSGLPHNDLLNRALYEDFHSTILPRILRNFDTMAMGNGVEVRMPFMDYRLVTFSFTLPSSAKIGGGVSKRIVREAVKDLLPPKIYHRKLKLGFNSPLQQWMPNDLRPWIEGVLASNSALDHVIDRKALKIIYQQKIITGKMSFTDLGYYWAMVSALRLKK